jgi:hypothetical protein
MAAERRCAPERRRDGWAHGNYSPPYFAKIRTATVMRATPVNNTLWPHRAINPIIFNLQSI